MKNMPELTRREFLKKSALVTAVFSLGLPNIAKAE